MAPRTTARWLSVAAVGIGLLFAWNVRSHYFLGDDAFISFRYANHLVHGHGLTWNAGEYVEGYTNFLWVLLMAGAMWTGISPEVAATAVSVASGAVILVLLPVFAARICGSIQLWMALPSLLLASSRTFTSWCTGGLETMVFTLLVFLALWAAIEERRSRTAYPLRSAIFVGLAALTRPEGILIAAVIAAWWLADIVFANGSVQPAAIWAVLVTATIGSHLLWRHWYYGAWLPNTFAAKVPAAWWDHGLKYAWLFARAYGLPFFVPLAVFNAIRQTDRDRALIVAVMGVYAAYVVAIGGDRFEFRFWVPILPLLVWSSADAVQALVSSRVLRASLAAILVIFTLHGSLQPQRAQLPRWQGVATIATIRNYAASRIFEARELRRLIDAGVLDRSLILAISAAGAVPYYTDWPTVDVLGLNDSYIAHLPVPKRGLIGHEHLAPVEYLRQRRVVMLDCLDQILVPADRVQRLPDEVFCLGERLPLRLVRVDDRFLAFATFVSEEALGRAFHPSALIR